MAEISLRVERLERAAAVREAVIGLGGMVPDGSGRERK